jgi:hypothetical protein
MWDRFRLTASGGVSPVALRASARDGRCITHQTSAVVRPANGRVVNAEAGHFKRIEAVGVESNAQMNRPRSAVACDERLDAMRLAGVCAVEGVEVRSASHRDAGGHHAIHVVGG